MGARNDIRISAWAAAVCKALGLLLAGGRLAHAAPSSCDAVVGNLVANCGFEVRDPLQWTRGGLGGVALSLSGVAHTGSRALDLAFDTDPSGSLFGSFVSQNVGGAGVYDVSFWLTFYTAGIVDPNRRPDLEVAFGDQTLNVDVTTVPLSGQDFVYGLYQFSNVATAAPATLRIGVSSTANVQHYEFLVDDVVVTGRPYDVPEPATLPLVFGALAGLAVLHRWKATRP